jgi:hypothetical protein
MHVPIAQVTAPWDKSTMPESIREKRDKQVVTTKGLVLAVNRGQRLRVRRPAGLQQPELLTAAVAAGCASLCLAGPHWASLGTCHAVFAEHWCMPLCVPVM